MHSGISVMSLDSGRVLEVEVWPLGADIETAVRIRGPAVVTSVPVVVRVAVRHVLDAVIALAVEPAAGLEGHRNFTCFLVLDSQREEKVYWHGALKSSNLIGMLTYKHDVHGDGDVLLGHVAVD